MRSLGLRSCFNLWQIAAAPSLRPVCDRVKLENVRLHTSDLSNKEFYFSLLVWNTVHASLSLFNAPL